MIFLELFWTFFTIGLFTIGGGYAMLPLIQEAVLSKGWMEQSQIVDFVAVSESTPGPFAVNIATYIGNILGAEKGINNMGGSLLGALCATLGVVLPSFIIILIVARIYEKFKESKGVMAVMSGLKPAVIGLIASAVVSIGQTVLKIDPWNIIGSLNKELALSLIIFAITLIMTFKKVHPIIVIVVSAVLGILTGFFIL